MTQIADSKIRMDLRLYDLDPNAPEQLRNDLIIEHVQELDGLNQEVYNSDEFSIEEKLSILNQIEIMMDSVAKEVAHA